PTTRPSSPSLEHRKRAELSAPDARHTRERVCEPYALLAAAALGVRAARPDEVLDAPGLGLVGGLLRPDMRPDDLAYLVDRRRPVADLAADLATACASRASALVPEGRGERLDLGQAAGDG